MSSEGSLRASKKESMTMPELLWEGKALRVPALIAAGEHDMSDFLAAASALAEAIPDSLLNVIAHAGHLAPLEVPQAFREMVIGFLDERAS
jgi:pimeloyl-ACP methyl ester carboxylesterase